MAIAEISLSKALEVSKLRYLVIIASSLVIMLCAGSVYAWSIFVAPLKSVYGLSTAETQIVYGCILGIFCLAAVFVHKINDRWGPKITAAAGALIFSAGYILASFSGGNLLILMVGLGLLSGNRDGAGLHDRPDQSGKVAAA